MKVIKYLFLSLVIISFGCQSAEEETFDEVAQFNEDLELIDQYILDKSLVDDTIRHWTGIRYIVHEEGGGVKARIGDIVSVDYKGYFLNDEVFDQGEFRVVLNSSGMILGWYYMLQEMDEGDSISIYMPSFYGYGQSGSGSIAPNTPLAFDMRLLKVGD